MFLKADEFILLMLGGPTRRLGLDELKRLRDAGVQTTYQLVDWNLWEPQPGVFDWGYVETDLELAQKAGLKTLLVGPDDGPSGYPAAWYAKGPNGVPLERAELGGYIWTCLSPWHAEARDFLLQRYNLFIRNFAQADVLCVRAGQHSGECLLPYEPVEGAIYDAAAIQSYRAFAEDLYAGDFTRYRQSNTTGRPTAWQDILPAPLRLTHEVPSEAHCTTTWLRQTLTAKTLEEQAFYATQPAHEIFGMLQRCWQDLWCTGNTFASELYIELQALPGIETLNVINYSYFDVNASSEYLKGLSQQELELGVKLWVGSSFCEGLLANTVEARGLGFRGFLTSPLSLMTAHTVLEDRMVAAFQSSHAQWCAL
jgi:hypothetical protein